jgi:hypothetical protein
MEEQLMGYIPIVMENLIRGAQSLLNRLQDKKESLPQYLKVGLHVFSCFHHQHHP